MSDHSTPRKLWEHPNPHSTEMFRFMQVVNDTEGLSLKTFQDLYHFSVTNRSQFWQQALCFLRLIYEGSYSEVVDETARIDTVPIWFNGIKLNFAENLLFRRSESSMPSELGTTGKEDDKIAITAIREGETEVRHITWRRLRFDVGRLASAMRTHGVLKGDRIGLVASNSYQTLTVFLACTAIGAIFSSSSTDMGTKGILDRLFQIKPKFVFVDDYSLYNGKTTHLFAKWAEVVKGLEDTAEFVGLVIMSRFNKPEVAARLSTKTMHFAYFMQRSTTSKLQFERVDFSYPFMIAYSSGTTGAPKCIVHSTGGALISSGKETILHSEITPESVVLQYTTTGWIMYFSAVMNLFAGARVVLYDGSPFQPDPTAFIRIIGNQKVTRLGVSPRWMAEIQKAGIVPRRVTNLSALKSVSSTGMVLSDRQFEWFYDVASPEMTHLANISGGTDIAGCFGIENPLSPLFVGGTQGPCLGTPVAVYSSTGWDGRINSQALPDGDAGELVATHAFPNMPAFFWNDTKPPSQSSKYFRAYFDKYDNAWTQGDFVFVHPVTKQLIFLGRADGVLNPSGIRFGSAEIYSVIEEHFQHCISDSLCVGQRRPKGDDETVFLFLLMKPGCIFSEILVRDVKEAIRKGLSARHVPKYIFETPEIPMTVNMKKVEQPVKKILSSQIVKASGTLLNPASLDFYYQFAEVENIRPSKSRL